MTVPEARKDARLRRYELRSLRVPFAGRSLPMVVPAAREWLREGTWVDRQRALDEPPYWVDIWPASLAALWALGRHPDLAGRRVLDLGCGVGVAGIAAAAAGAEVTFCDGDADAVAFAGWNARRLAADGDAVATITADWNDVAFDHRFDVLILADVTYRIDQQARLADLAASCLEPDGVVLHADPGRWESTRFLRVLARQRQVDSLRRGVTHGDRKTVIRLALAGDGGARHQAWRARVVGASRTENVAP